MQSLLPIVEFLRTCRSVLVATHIYPDPDAIGSASALVLGLQSLGINAEFYLTCSVPFKMKTLVGNVPIRLDIPRKEYDAVVVVDCANKSRTGDEADRLLGSGKSVVCVDHHVSNESFGRYCYVDHELPATAVIIYDLLTLLGVKFTPQIANLLYAGLSDDTGSFRYHNTSATALEYAAKIVKAGAHPAEVANALYYSVPQRVLMLRSRAMSHAQFLLDGRLCLVSVTLKMLEQCGCKADDTEGIVEEARLSEGVVVAAFIRELPDGWKISLRSKDERVNVNSIASMFGGGGHIMAAGYKTAGSYDEVEKTLLLQVKEQLQLIEN